MASRWRLELVDDDGDRSENDDEEALSDDSFEGGLVRIHGVGRVTKQAGKLVIRKQILVEDEDGFDVRVRITNDNEFGGDEQSLTLADDELAELIRALELVAKRRGILEPTNN